MVGSLRRLRWLRWLAALPVSLATLAVTLLWWLISVLLRLQLDTLLFLGGETRGGPLLRTMVLFATEGVCPRCSWTFTREVYELLTGRRRDRIEHVDIGRGGASVIFSGRLAPRVVAAVEHVKRLGGDPCAIAERLFEIMLDMNPREADLLSRERN